MNPKFLTGKMTVAIPASWSSSEKYLKLGFLKARPEKQIFVPRLCRKSALRRQEM